MLWDNPRPFILPGAGIPGTGGFKRLRVKAGQSPQLDGVTNLPQNLTSCQARQDVWQDRAELSGWQGFREERKRDVGRIWKPGWGQGSTKAFLCTAEPVPRHPHLLPVLQTAVTPRGEANRLGAKPPPAEGTSAGHDPQTHLERFQERLLHGQPAILSEKLEREAKNQQDC